MLNFVFAVAKLVKNDVIHYKMLTI